MTTRALRGVARPGEAPGWAAYDGAVPGPLTSSRRRARRGWGVAVVALCLAGVIGLTGCTDGVGDPSGASAPVSVSATPSAAATGGAASPADTAAVTEVLARRAAAVVSGDRPSYAATVADASSPSGRRQLDSFSAARALRVSRVEVGEPVVDLETAADQAATGVPLRARAEVDVRYRVDDLDRGDRVARLGYDLVRAGSGWQVEAERPVGAGATAPWVAMPGLRVRRGKHAVVAGTAPTGRLAEHVAVADRALPVLRGQWSATPERVLVLAPATAAEADALLGRASGSGAAPVAATTEGPTGPEGTATGDRVVLDPTAVRPAHREWPRRRAHPRARPRGRARHRPGAPSGLARRGLRRPRRLRPRRRRRRSDSSPRS